VKISSKAMVKKLRENVMTDEEARKKVVATEGERN